MKKIKNYVTYARLKGSKCNYTRIIVSTVKSKKELAKHLKKNYNYELAAPPARLTKIFKKISFNLVIATQVILHSCSEETIAKPASTLT